MAVYEDQIWSPPPAPNQRQARLQNQPGPEVEMGPMGTHPESGKLEETSKKRWRGPRWLCWPFKRFIMGKLSAFFKRSDDRAKSPSPSVSNPYAVNEPSPSPVYQHEQYNSQQYNGNQFIAQSAQGLPPDPRPGGSHSKVAPPSRTSTLESNKTTSPVLPPYNENSPQLPVYSSPSGSAQASPALGSNVPSPSLPSAGGRPGPPAYSSPSGSAHASPALGSNAPSPSISSAAGRSAPPSYTPNPSMGSGYSREKYGAPDGYGNARFEDQAGTQYNQPAMLSSQRQGGYGNLDAESGDLFEGYNGPSKQTHAPGISRTPVPAEQPYVVTPDMTEEERDTVMYNQKKAEVDQTRNETEDVLDSALAKAQRFRDGIMETHQDVDRQGEMLGHAYDKMMEAEWQGQLSHLNIKDLKDHTGSMFKVFTARSRREKLDDERARQDFQAKQARQEAQALKREALADPGASALPKSHSTLCPPKPRAQNRFILEDDDVEQETRIEEKLTQLSSVIGDARAGLGSLGQKLDNQNMMIKSLDDKTDRVHDRVLTSQDHLRRIR
ncbi:hypothetical protein VTI74DRAFT_1383 [Chaetomium olivicolor]